MDFEPYGEPRAKGVGIGDKGRKILWPAAGPGDHRRERHWRGLELWVRKMGPN